MIASRFSLEAMRASVRFRVSSSGQENGFVGHAFDFVQEAGTKQHSGHPDCGAGFRHESLSRSILGHTGGPRDGRARRAPIGLTVRRAYCRVTKLGLKRRGRSRCGRHRAAQRALDHENKKVPISKPAANAHRPNVQAETMRTMFRRSFSCEISSWDRSVIAAALQLARLARYENHHAPSQT